MVNVLCFLFFSVLRMCLCECEYNLTLQRRLRDFPGRPAITTLPGGAAGVLGVQLGVQLGSLTRELRFPVLPGQKPKT